jgi:hypothetical protein
MRIKIWGPLKLALIDLAMLGSALLATAGNAQSPGEPITIDPPQNKPIKIDPPANFPRPCFIIPVEGRSSACPAPPPAMQCLAGAQHCSDQSKSPGRLVPL